MVKTNGPNLVLLRSIKDVYYGLKLVCRVENPGDPGVWLNSCSGLYVVVIYSCFRTGFNKSGKEEFIEK